MLTWIQKPGLAQVVFKRTHRFVSPARTAYDLELDMIHFDRPQAGVATRKTLCNALPRPSRQASTRRFQASARLNSASSGPLSAATLFKQRFREMLFSICRQISRAGMAREQVASEFER